MANYYNIYGYWKDDKTELSGIVKDMDDVLEGEDDSIFFYGLSENDIIEAINLVEKTGHDFVITGYEKLDM